MSALGLAAPDLPQLTLALPIGERFQSAVLGTTKRWLGHVPLELNPHEGGRPALDHRHPFYLAEDADGDGRIDHLLLYAPRGLSPDWRQLLGEVRPAAAPQGDLPQFEATAQWLGNADGKALPCRLLGHSRVWRSVTPYVPNVHLKASKLTAPDALARELAQRGLPACEIQELSGYEAWGQDLERNDFIIERPDASDPKAQNPLLVSALPSV